LYNINITTTKQQQSSYYHNQQLAILNSPISAPVNMASIARNRLQRIAQTAGKFHKPKPQLKEAAKKTQWNILRGDKVQVIGSHPERGKQGIVMKVLRDKDRVLVEGVNMGPRNIKGDKDRGIPGKVIMKERTIHYSNVNLVDPVQGVPTRVSKKFLDTGEKVRIAKKSGAIIPRPEILTFRKKPISSVVTESCTAEDDAWEITYQNYIPPTAKLAE
jgi:large subunit ribosomal protein L24